jgi:hypothetical protein
VTLCGPNLSLQILTLRRKLNYMFKVLTGNVTGHYALDLRNSQHRDVGMFITGFHFSQSVPGNGE